VGVLLGILESIAAAAIIAVSVWLWRRGKAYFDNQRRLAARVAACVSSINSTSRFNAACLSSLFIAGLLCVMGLHRNVVNALQGRVPRPASRPSGLILGTKKRRALRTGCKIPSR
jgi:hypothetical protein